LLKAINDLGKFNDVGVAATLSQVSLQLVDIAYLNEWVSRLIIILNTFVFLFFDVSAILLIILLYD